MIQYALDITERKKAEEALAESEAKWRSLTENSPDHIMMLDRDGKILFINHTIPGLTSEQVIGTSFFDYALPEYEHVTKLCFDRVLRTAAPDKFESTYLSENGTLLYFESYVGPVIQSDKVIGLTVSSRDISERKQAELSLQKSLQSVEAGEQRFRATAQSAGDAIISINQKGEIIFWNHAAEQIFGYTSEEMTKQSITVLMPQRFRAAHTAGMQRVLTTGQSKLLGKTIEMVGLRKDGHDSPSNCRCLTGRLETRCFSPALFGILPNDVSCRRH